MDHTSHHAMATESLPKNGLAGIKKYFSQQDFMPHGHCYLWKPGLVVTHVVSDLLIGLSYVTISLILYRLFKRIKIPFSTMFVAFGLFIAACGLTHFMEIWNLWQADYWAAGLIKIVTAVASVATAVWLYFLAPNILQFAEAAKVSEQRRLELVEAYAEMENRVKERTQEVETLYQTAKRANELKDEFLATMSHELRTPLTAIMGFSEMLLQEDEATPEQRTMMIESINRNSRIQEQMVNDLLDVSTIISGKMRFEPTVVNVQETLQHALESMSLAAHAKELEFELDITERPLHILGESTRLQQIIWNFLSNAVKFTDRGGKIKIELYTQHSSCVIKVTDTGMGIDPQFLPRIFDRFSQEDSSTSRKFGGLGLGLGIVRHLVELHGGTIFVTSEGKNKGSSFQVTIPLAAIHDHKTAAPVDYEAKIRKGLKVLLVEDENEIRQYVATVLMAAGLEVQQASSAKEALELMKEFTPNVLISDIGMPVMDGLELVREIRARENANGGFIPCIALTAYVHEGAREKIMSAGYQQFLTKPIPREDLLRAIIKVMS